MIDTSNVSLRDMVFYKLREAILKGEIAPGSRLMEISLAEKLGVSRTPIREAIKKLEQEGLVIMIPKKGAKVADITEKDLKDVLEVRCALEELAVSIACKNCTESMVRALRKNIADFRANMNTNKTEKLAQLDIEFHDIILKSSNNKVLIKLLSDLHEQMYRFRFEYLKDKYTHDILLREHEAIFNDIINNNVREAKLHVHTHIYNQVTIVSNKLKKKGQSILLDL